MSGCEKACRPWRVFDCFILPSWRNFLHSLSNKAGICGGGCFPRDTFLPLSERQSQINSPGNENESLVNMKTRPPHISNPMKHSSRDCRPFAGLLIPLVLVCFTLLPRAQAVGPDTDGTIPGSNNGEGIGVLVNRTSGVWNTGTGFEALSQLTAGNQNTATGLRALSSDTNGGFNTATGVLSLFSNTIGFFNSANGAYSLANNTIANYNTANGYAALYKNTTGVGNTANGYLALYSNTTSNLNTATGYQALYSNTTSGANTANGTYALFNNTGGDNIALGYFAGSLLTTGSNNIDIGNNGVAGESATIRIGSGQTRTFIAGIFGATASGGMQVFINSAGQLGTATSSRRYKKEIKAMEQTSESILALKPVTFHYKSDATDTPQFGLIAEEVAEINPDLVVR